MFKLMYLGNGNWSVTFEGRQRAPLTLEQVFSLLKDAETY